MAVSSVRTLLPLDRFTRILSFSPLMFNQVYVPDLAPPSACVGPLLQYTWQPRNGGMPGRDEIAEAIKQAEELITRQLGFPPVPTWVADDALIPPSAYFGGPGGFGMGYAYYELGLITDQKHVQYGGREALAAIQFASAVTYTDQNGDGYKELATVTVNTTVTDVNQIAVFYPGESGDAAWEIRPIRVSIAGGIATIRFDREQAVNPDLLTRLDAEGVDGLEDDNFLATVDVYRRYNDPSQMAIVEWDNGCWCAPAACTIYAQSACLAVKNGPAGIINVHAANYSVDDESWTHTYPTWWGKPTRVRAWYRAGLMDQTRPRPWVDMKPDLERAIAFLALALMDRQWENCEQLHNLQDRWKQDLAYRESSPTQSSSYNTTRSQLENPFGTTRAAQYAWSVVQPLMVGEAVTGS